jgi:hypothetical protein
MNAHTLHALVELVATIAVVAIGRLAGKPEWADVGGAVLTLKCLASGAAAYRHHRQRRKPVYFRGTKAKRHP